MGLLKFILSSDSRRSLKKISAIADKILALSPRYEAMSDGELKNQTEVLKSRLANGETLDEILIDAFAVVREASARVLNMRHYKVQLMGGVCVHQGRIAELKTGEGKTLMATLPAYLNALNGKGVHIVTVNDYLAKRDAAWMGKIHRFLGLTVGVISPEMDDNARREAYAADITYGTNNDLGFDYLRDNLKVRYEDRVQRELEFAIVDEVDSILIDEARTPLIISGRGEDSSDLYKRVDAFVKKLVEDEDFTVDIKEKTVQITESGARKAEKAFSIENFSDPENAELSHHVQQALKAHHVFKRDNDYIVQDKEIIIVDEFTGRLMIGRRYSDGLHQAIEAKEGVIVRSESKTLATITFQNYFRQYKKLSGMTGTAKTEEEEFKTIYGLDVLEIPTNMPMIRVDENDIIYSTQKSKINAIIDEVKDCNDRGQPVLIGTVTVEKSEEIAKALFRRGIRANVLNAKNHRREAEIIAQAGKKGAVTVATNMAGRGTDILLGGNPEYLAKQELRNKGVDEDKIELATSFVQDLPADIEALRAQYNELLAKHKKVTDAEKEEVIALGGLRIIGTERHESRRIDNQLRGRAGRQGDPGSSQFYISLEDDLAKRFGGDRMMGLYRKLIDDDTPLQVKMLSRAIENAQKNIEGQNFGIRKHVIQYDDVMNTQRMVMYGERMKVLKGENIHEDILSFIPDYVEIIVGEAVDEPQKPHTWDKGKITEAIEAHLMPVGTNMLENVDLAQWDYGFLLEKITEKTIECYENKIAECRERGNDFDEFERVVLLKVIDKKWIDHIDDMERLKRGISLRGYANEDPIIAYKREGLEMFDQLTASIREEVAMILLRIRPDSLPERREQKVMVESGGGSGTPQQARSTKTVGRNDPCPCGSGRKYKNCCGKNS